MGGSEPLVLSTNVSDEKTVTALCGGLRKMFVKIKDHSDHENAKKIFDVCCETMNEWIKND